METDCEKLYMNLNDLLQEICKFLSHDKLRVLSPRDKKIAESLINRCKVQLQEIAKIQQPVINNEYVDMGSQKYLDKPNKDYVDTENTKYLDVDSKRYIEMPRKKSVDIDNKKVAEEIENGKNDIYSSIDGMNIVEATSIEEETTYPYNDLPAKDASQEIKSGFISMRRKFLLGFEKMKKVYGCIHNKWLLIYWTDKDPRPICSFDLRNYEAKADDDRGTTFELLSTLSDRKVFYFMGITPKDKAQWVVNINQCRNRGESQNDDEEDDDSDKIYDSVNPRNNFEQVEEEDEIYDTVTIVHQTNKPVVSEMRDGKYDPRPALPGRKPFKKSPLPIAPPLVPPQEESDGSVVSYNDIHDLAINADKSKVKTFSASSVALDDSFSDDNDDDDEDSIYEVFVEVSDVVKKYEPKNCDVIKENLNPPPLPKLPAVPVLPALKSKVNNRPPVAMKPSIRKILNNE